MLKIGDYVGIVACSNARKEVERENIEKLCNTLKDSGLNIAISDYIYSIKGVFSGSADEKADALMKMYSDKRVKIIADISGGDMCNELLDKIDYKLIAENYKPFFGYSDLTAIINAIYTKTGNISYLYQVRNLVSDYEAEQKSRFFDFVIGEKNNLFDFEYHFIRGKAMSGIVVGGNIRCLLKLAGTEYMPDFTDKILFLESLAGGIERTVACMSQLRQMGVFNRVSGVLLGEFTYMDGNDCKPNVEEILLQEIGNDSVPIARTMEIGHSPNSKALKIGGYYTLLV